MDRQDELNALERRLGNLRPAPLAIDRDRVLYLAGREAALVDSRGRAIGAASLVCLALVSVGLGGLLLVERGRRMDLERAVAGLSKPAEPTRVELIVSGSPPSPSSYRALTRQANLWDEAQLPPLDAPGSRHGGSAYRESPLSPLSARYGLKTMDF